MVSQIETKVKTDIIYPETDGKPMANNTIQFRWILVIEQNLELLYASKSDVFVAGDLFWYPLEGNNKIVTAPDIMVTFGRPKGDRGSYKQWEENNIPPQVVFEILSPSNTSREMAQKLLFYERYGVEEYYIYDPSENHLEGWLRGNYGLELIDSIDNWISPRLQIRFDVSGEELQIYRPDDKLFFSYLEISQQLNEAEKQLNEERKKSKEMEELLKQYQERFGNLS